MAIDLMNPYNLRTLHPKFQKIWSRNKVARALLCLAWAPPNLACWQSLATGFCFWPFAKLFLVQLILDFKSKLFICCGNCVPIAIWIGENSEHPSIHIKFSKEYRLSQSCYLNSYYAGTPSIWSKGVKDNIISIAVFPKQMVVSVS